MAAGYQIRDQNEIQFITFAVVEWVAVFTRKDYANLVVESLQCCQKEKGLIPAALEVFHLTRRPKLASLGKINLFQKAYSDSNLFLLLN